MIACTNLTGEERSENPKDARSVRFVDASLKNFARSHDASANRRKFIYDNLR
jgi:hypothetical protein